MKKLTLLAALTFVALIARTPSLAWAPGNGSELPPVVDCKTGPLTPQQLTSDERTQFDKLSAGSAEATKFLFTRGYLRYAKLVVAGSIQPADLPCLPARENWSRGYLTPDEAKNILDVALGRKLVASMRTDLPSAPALVLLRPEQLDLAEKAAFAKLPAGSDAARKFLYTRSFLRPCRKVVDRSLEPTQLPDLPRKEDWDRRYLSAVEGKEIVDVCLGMSMAAMLK